MAWFAATVVGGLFAEAFYLWGGLAGIYRLVALFPPSSLGYPLSDRGASRRGRPRSALLAIPQAMVLRRILGHAATWVAATAIGVF